MLQRWMKSLAVVATIGILFTNCKKNTYSPDEPLANTYTPSVFISSQNKILYALDPASGAYKWQLNVSSNVVATPVVAGDFLYLPTVDTLMKINVKTGKIVSRLQVLKPATSDPNIKVNILTSIISSPYTDGKTVWVATCLGQVFAFDVNTDNLKWEYDATDSVMSSLMVYTGNIIAVTTKGAVHAINMNSGIRSWLNSSAIVGVNALRSSPVGSGTNIYVGSPDGRIYAFNGSNGTSIWQYNIGSVIDGSPIVYGGNIIVGSADNYVYCIDSAAKAERWKFKTQDRVLASAGATGQIVFIGGYDSYIYALNILDGSLKWKYKTGALIESASLVVGGSVYVAGFDKHLYKFDTSGTLKWKYNVSGPIETSPILYDISRTYYPSITGLGQY